MARHPWVAKADDGVRWGMQVVVPARRDALLKLMDVARQMESLGFDSLFVMDHPALHADPYIALSGAAAVTEKLHLGQLVMAATYRHPAFVARMQTDLDNLSGGRSVLPAEPYLAPSLAEIPLLEPLWVVPPVRA